MPQNSTERIGLTMAVRRLPEGIDFRVVRIFGNLPEEFYRKSFVLVFLSHRIFTCIQRASYMTMRGKKQKDQHDANTTRPEK